MGCLERCGPVNQVGGSLSVTFRYLAASSCMNRELSE